MVSRLVLAAIAAGTMVHVPAQEPSLPEALGKAADYVARYRIKASGVSLEELLLLTEMGTTQRVPRRVASDLVLVNTTERLMGLRDPFALDTKAVREHQPRIIKALGEPTLASWQRVQEFAREGSYLLLANAVLWYSDPMLALRFMEVDHQPRMTYKLEGRKKIDGVQVYGIGFKENREERKVYLLDTPDNPWCSGRIWIEPATGAIHQTELWVQSDTAVARVQVHVHDGYEDQPARPARRRTHVRDARERHRPDEHGRRRRRAGHDVRVQREVHERSVHANRP